MTSQDYVDDSVSVDVTCVIDDVFVGQWTWAANDELMDEQCESPVKQVRFNLNVEVCYIDASVDDESSAVNTLASTPCPSDRWCVGGRMVTDGSRNGSPFSKDNWCTVESGVDSMFDVPLSDSFASRAEAFSGLGGPVTSEFEDDLGDSMTLMQRTNPDEHPADGLRVLGSLAPGRNGVKVKVWFIGRRNQQEHRPYVLTLRKDRVHEWQHVLRGRWCELFGEGSPFADVVAPSPPVRDFEEAFPAGDAHVLMSLHSGGVAVLLDISCPDWTMRHAWVVQARTVADLFVRVGLTEYLYDPRYECILEDEGVIRHVGYRLHLQHGYYGKLVVTEVMANDGSSDTSRISSARSVATASTDCGSGEFHVDSNFDEVRATTDFTSLFQSFEAQVGQAHATLDGVRCRHLGEGQSRLDHLPVDIPDPEEDLDVTDAAFSDDDDMLRTSNPQNLYDLQDTLPPDIAGTWRLVSFGLRDFHLGRKDATLHSLELAYIEQAVWMLWQDDVPQFAPLIVHFIVPQPLRALGLENAVVVVAEILRDSQAEADHADLSAVLNLQVDNRGIAIRSPRAHATPFHSRFDHLHEVHEDSYLCQPFGVRDCALSVGGILRYAGDVVDVIPGSLNQLALADSPSVFIAARAWFPKVEIWASHVMNEHYLDGVDEFLASIYVPGQHRCDVPFRLDDARNPLQFKAKIAAATNYEQFALIYVEDNLVTSISRAEGRQHHLMLWNFQDIQQPIFVAVASPSGHPAFHVTAVSFNGLIDVRDLQTRVELQLGLEHRELVCTQQGQQVGFYGLDPELVVVFRPPVFPTSRVANTSSDVYDEVPNEELDDDGSRDSMSLLQHHWMRTTETKTMHGYTEDNSDLRSGPTRTTLDLAEALALTPCPSDRWCVRVGVDADQAGASQSVDPRLTSLRRTLVDLAQPWPIDGITPCYDLIPNLHPFAQIALASAKGIDVGPVTRYHIFTDGSARRGSIQQAKAAWAFHVVCESGVGACKVFHRLGYSGALLDRSHLHCCMDALDAEATALLFVADWLISQQHPMACTVHFDAQAVGYGTFGTYNVACTSTTIRPLQCAARAVLAIAQACHPGLIGTHVKAHAGQPDNEIADSVAYAILQGWTPPCTPPYRLESLIQHPLRDWAWIECAPTPELPSIETLLRTPGVPPQQSADYFEIQSDQVQATCTTVTWHIGSANVSTLADHDPKLSDKVAVLQKQMEQGGLDILVLQECRGRHDLCYENDDFIRVGSAAERGQGGVEMWLRKGGAFWHTGLGEIQKDQLVAWHADHRLLCVSILHPAFECDFACIYAPQSGRDEQEIQAWWQRLCQVLSSRPSHGPLFLVGDANAKIGAVTTRGIGDFAPDFEDCAGSLLRACCDKFSLTIPATFATWHSGPTATFSSARGGHSRVDYIAVPEVWCDGVESSWVCEDFDLLNGDYEHKLIAVAMTLQVVQHGHKSRGRCSVYDRGAARDRSGLAKLAHLTSLLPEVAWDIDVNDHWTLMRQTVVEQCKSWFPKPKRTRRQLYLSEQAWNIVCERKDLSIALRGYARSRDWWLLFLCWHGWRNAPARLGNIESRARLIDQQAALDLWKRDCLTRQFRKLRQDERKQWSIRCTAQLSHDLQVNAVGQWFKLIKPKRALKHSSQTRCKLPGLRDENGRWITKAANVSLMWQRHFGAIENADEGQADDILSQSQPQPHLNSIDELIGIPSLFDLEKAMRTMNAKKAAGPDQLGAEVWQANVPKMAKKCYALFLKSGLRQQWVAEFAGGDLIPLFKKGDASNPCNYRAILLEPVLGRVFSRAWRCRLNAAMHLVQAPFQFGGHRAISIEIAHLLVRNAQQISAGRKQACGLIFADIKSAFYSVAKPFLSHDHVGPDELVALFHRMKLPPENLMSFVEAVEEGVVIPDSDGGQLRGVVASMVRHSWAKVPGADRYILPRTGSRPGDPLADTLFGFLMAKCMHRIAARFDQEELTTVWSGPHGAVPALAWVDDAVFHLEASSQVIVSKVTQALQVVHEEMLRMGLQPNYGAGKTEVLLSFKGKRATQSAQDFHRQQQGVLRVLNEVDGMLSVRTVNAYKHLGGFVTRKGSLHPELRVRGAQTQQQLRGLKHVVLSDPALPLASRQTILKSLGLSVLTLHAGTWRPMQLGEWKTWQGMVHTAYQQLHHRGSDGSVPHLSTLELAVGASSPMPHGLLHIRRLRVFTQLCKCGDMWMLDNVLCSAKELGDAAWLHGIREALVWAKHLCDECDWMPQLDDLSNVNAWGVLKLKWKQIHKLVQKVEALHCFRNKMCLELQQTKQEHDRLLNELGWEDRRETAVETDIAVVTCQECGFTTKSYAGLAVHEQRVHGKRIIARRVATGPVCSICYRSYHTRPRLIIHLQYGHSPCLVRALRRGLLCSEEEARQRDQQDVDAGHAHHMKGVKEVDATQPFHEGAAAMEDDADDGPITDAERTEWSRYGLLPVRLGGRPPTTRTQQMPAVYDSVDELGHLELQWQQEAASWLPPTTDVPRPLADGKLYFLVFFAGHRRYGDLICQLEWRGKVQPIPIDLAIDKVWGDARKGGLWEALIRSGKVLGAHMGPPCETYTDARWLPAPDDQLLKYPRPLRDAMKGWGMAQRNMKELKQVQVGNYLMWISFTYMMLIALYGGCATLEHPKGVAPRRNRFSVWVSSLTRRVTRSKIWQVVDFLQGPLGVAYSKPTRILHLRLPELPQLIYAAYDKAWRPSEKLGGLDDNGEWRTMKAKAYPERLNAVLADSYMLHFRRCQRSGHVPDPDELGLALEALTHFYDPYINHAKGSIMARDYHGDVQ